MSIRMEDVAGMDFSDVADVAAGKLAPIHPGEILREDFLLPLGISQYRLAKEIGVRRASLERSYKERAASLWIRHFAWRVLRNRCTKLDQPAHSLQHRACKRIHACRHESDSSVDGGSVGTTRAVY